jgi:hypothetical protein
MIRELITSLPRKRYLVIAKAIILAKTITQSITLPDMNRLFLYASKIFRLSKALLKFFQVKWIGSEKDELRTSLEGLKLLLMIHTKGKIVVTAQVLRIRYINRVDILNFFFLFIFLSDIRSPLL